MRFWSADPLLDAAAVVVSEPSLAAEPVVVPCSAAVSWLWMADATLALTEPAVALDVPPSAAVAFASMPCTICVSLSAAASSALGAAGCNGGGPDGPLTSPLPVPVAEPVVVPVDVAVDVPLPAVALAPAVLAWLFASTWLAATCAVKRLSVEVVVAVSEPDVAVDAALVAGVEAAVVA